MDEISSNFMRMDSNFNRCFLLAFFSCSSTSGIQILLLKCKSLMGISFNAIFTSQSVKYVGNDLVSFVYNGDEDICNESWTRTDTKISSSRFVTSHALCQQACVSTNGARHITGFE